MFRALDLCQSEPLDLGCCQQEEVKGGFIYILLPNVFLDAVIAPTLMDHKRLAQALRTRNCSRRELAMMIVDNVSNREGRSSIFTPRRMQRPSSSRFRGTILRVSRGRIDDICKEGFSAQQGSVSRFLSRKNPSYWVP